MVRRSSRTRQKTPTVYDLAAKALDEEEEEEEEKKKQEENE
jgi:hypothetical protein